MKVWSVGACSLCGPFRKKNEDSILAFDSLVHSARDASSGIDARTVGRPRILAAIADGMGGRPGGEAAAVLALQALGSHVLEMQELDSRELVALFERIDREVALEGLHAGTPGMGTTLTALGCAEGADSSMLWLAHCGDCRAYLLREGVLTRLSTDHNQAALFSGGAPNILTSCLGCRIEHLRVDVTRMLAVAGDVFVLCSDGFYQDWPANELEAALNAALSAPENAGKRLSVASQALCTRAVESGSSDNASVVLIEMKDDAS